MATTRAKHVVGLSPLIELAIGQSIPSKFACGHCIWSRKINEFNLQNHTKLLRHTTFPLRDQTAFWTSFMRQERLFNDYRDTRHQQCDENYELIFKKSFFFSKKFSWSTAREIIATTFSTTVTRWRCCKAPRPSGQYQKTRFTWHANPDSKTDATIPCNRAFHTKDV